MIFDMGDLEVLKQNDTYKPCLDLGGRLLNDKCYMSIVVTNKCNRKCAYCINSSTDGKSDLPLNKALANIRKAHDNLGIKECVILGGEPTLYPDLIELVRSLSAMGFEKIIMTSNGVELHRPLIDSLIDAGLTHLNVSVHNDKGLWNTIGLSEMQAIYDVVNHRIPVRVNTNVWKGNHDTLYSLDSWLFELQSCSDTIRVSNLIHKDSFSVNPKNSDDALERIHTDEYYNELFDSLIEKYARRMSLIHNHTALGFVDYTLIPTKSAIIINRNIDSKVSEQVCENDLSHLKVNTIKCLVTGDLSLSWNANNIVNI